MFSLAYLVAQGNALASVTLKWILANLCLCPFCLPLSVIGLALSAPGYATYVAGWTQTTTSTGITQPAAAYVSDRQYGAWKSIGGLEASLRARVDALPKGATATKALDSTWTTAAAVAATTRTDGRSTSVEVHHSAAAGLSVSESETLPLGTPAGR